MKKYIGILLTAITLYACQSEKESAQEISLVTDYKELFSKFTQDDNKLYVVNYWATWCKPCVKELPYFMEVNEEMQSNKNFEMLFVSLDKADELETGVKTFIEQNNIPTNVYLLSDNKRQAEWIPLVNERWSGAIPATALYKNGKQVVFKEGALTKEELKELINNHL